MKRIFLILFTLGLVNCASSQPEGSAVGTRLNQSDYVELLAKHTRKLMKYEGFYNKFEVYALYVNSEVQSAMLQRRSDVFQWDETAAQKEREKMFQENSTVTKFGVSLYTPAPRLNDLNKGNSIWRIYLVTSDGKRYEGKATKRGGKLEDVSTIFPSHNRWSIAYEVVFDVPLSMAEAGPVKLILTSTQGTAELEYN